MKAPQTVENTNDTAPRPKRQFVLIERLFQQSNSTVTVRANEEQSAISLPASTASSVPTTTVSEEPMIEPGQAIEVSAQPELPRHDTPDRELGKLSELAAATAKKHREALKMLAVKGGSS